MTVYVCRKCKNTRRFISHQFWNNETGKTSIQIECGECGSTDLIITSSLSHYPEMTYETVIQKMIY